MPCKSRIDTLGALHHIIARGIDHKNIFNDDKDRDNFLERIGSIIETFEKCSVLFKFKEGENFNRRNMLNILRIKI
ncbi:MAG: hypothetical protein L6263_13325 [Desulfobacteraceae bacterium]|nr:hypothetical protein [Desulfobacteraceae bacterium]